jgi:mRNA-degrading endonuclease RelE of RelBE toxin-antitoxin system
MRHSFTPHFQRSYQKLPADIQRAFDKKFLMLLHDIKHPSLRAKKYDESRNLWQGRVTKYYRFYFEIRNDLYIFHEIQPHGD